MQKECKRLKILKTFISEPTYSIENAILLLKVLGNANFIESTEVHISLNIDPKNINQQLRSNLLLPHGTGKMLRLAVFTETSSISDALMMGATIAGEHDLLTAISLGKCDFDILITTPALMPRLAKFGKILGPKGLMPSPRSGTITQNLHETLNEFKKGKREYRADKTGVVHLSFGKINFSEQQLKENLIAVYNSIQKNKPTGIKGKYFKSFYICTTMSPSIKVELNSFKDD